MNARDLVPEQYVDALGDERTVERDTRERVISLLEAGAADGITTPARVIFEGAPVTVDVTLPAERWNENALWTLRTERGAVRAGTILLADVPVVGVRQTERGTIDTRRLTIPELLPVGDHRLTLDVSGVGHAGIDVLVCPRRCWLGPEDAAWGIAVQLYTLRSERNWGIGDFADLGRVCTLAADLGATLVGINPLHASHRTDPESASPYAPASRRFLNWLAIAVDLVPEAQSPAVAAVVAQVASELPALRAAPFVDYRGVARLKEAALRRCFAALGGERIGAFRAYVRAAGEPLRRFAIYEALVAMHGRDLDAWPRTYADPAGAAVASFAAEHRDEVEFGQYLQWCAYEQLARVAADARARGVRLYRDIAVGVERNAADVWGSGDYVRQATVGAPPDILNTRGQDWGLPPLSPTSMLQDRYEAAAAVFADNMRDAGAVRIDHAMSLQRLYWIPLGNSAADGAYVSYPLEDLVGILARASMRARCTVVGEDLGTVPAGFRETMSEANILSYRLMLFERENDGTFLPPSRYPALALATTGTHDLPPLPGWLAAEDIAVAERIGQMDAEAAGASRIARSIDRSKLIAALQQGGDLGTSVDEASVVAAAYRFLARSPARIVMVQIEDAIGETSPVNVPGTSVEYPNWRRKLHLTLDAIAADPRLTRIATVMRELRPTLRRA